MCADLCVCMRLPWFGFGVWCWYVFARLCVVAFVCSCWFVLFVFMYVVAVRCVSCVVSMFVCVCVLVLVCGCLDAKAIILALAV